MVTHHFNDEDDYTQGGYFADDYGRHICDWTWEADARIIEVTCGMNGHREDLSSFNKDWLTDDELRKRLPDVARDLAKQIRGKELDE